MKADLHTHSNKSDGTDTPTELVHKAAALGLDMVALADHDSYAGLDEAAAAADIAGIGFLPSIEISCRYAGADVHLLGYRAGPDDDLDMELAKARQSRVERLPEMLRRLADAGMPITAEEVHRWARTSAAQGRPHVADAMVARGYVENRDQAFGDWLGDGRPGYVPRYTIDLSRAIRLVVQAGGRPVIAHPWARRTAAVLTPQVLGRLAESGLVGIEVDHPEHDREARIALRGLAGELGLLVTGSSDYHGLGKTNNALGCETTHPEVVEVLAQPLRGSR